VINNLRTQAESNRALAEDLIEQQRKQQEASQTLTQEAVGAYMDFLGSVLALPHEGTQTTARPTRRSDLERSAESDREEGATQADAVSHPLGSWVRVSGRARTTFAASRTAGYAASARRT
jgi:hypothetical protein